MTFVIFGIYVNFKNFGTRKTNFGQFSMFFDLVGSGISNVDMTMTRSLIGILKSYYPNSINYLLIFEMPWVFNGKRDYH